MTDDGRVAALFGKTLRVLGADRTQLFQVALGHTLVGDVAINARSDARPDARIENAVQRGPPGPTRLLAERNSYFATLSLPRAPPLCLFDVNADGVISAARDELVLMCALQHVASNTCTACTGVPSAATHTARTRATIAKSSLALDIEGNGTVDAAVDGLLLLRSLLGTRGSVLTTGALGVPPTTGAWRNTPEAVEAYLATQCIQWRGLDSRVAARIGRLAASIWGKYRYVILSDQTQ